MSDDIFNDARSTTDDRSALSVTDAMTLAKTGLESIVVTVIGEVSELSNKPGYKAVYFTIKDERSSLPCMMWMNRFKESSVDMKIGCLVQITGRFSLYMAKGRMNFDVFSISLAGEGNLRLQVANLANKLKAEGLMERSRKLAIPPFPERIGIVTSPRGAAVHDVLRTLRRRYPYGEVLLAGVPVEGQSAPRYLIEGMQTVIDAGADVVLLVRGGGSFEDLMPFNDEHLARFIAASSIPIVTGIGHEPDNSIADMVADLRTSTPTAAAEAITPSVAGLGSVLDNLGARMYAAEMSAIAQRSALVSRIEAQHVFRDPMSLFANEAQALDDLSSRLTSAPVNMLNTAYARLNVLEATFSHSLSTALIRERTEVSYLCKSFARSGGSLLSNYRTTVSVLASRLEDLSPLGVIARGYAICQTESGDIIKSVDDINDADKLNVVISDGTITCDVISKEKEEICIDSF